MVTLAVRWSHFLDWALKEPEKFYVADFVPKVNLIQEKQGVKYNKSENINSPRSASFSVPQQGGSLLVPYPVFI